ncbi:MAG: type II toxin-antitoxin system VapC family toxin [Luteibacter sp.]
MIVLDTNVLSELMRERSDAGVVLWLKRWPPAALFTTSISHAEIMFGIRCLPAGQRRDVLDATARHILDVVFSGRVLNFDRDAADCYAALAAARRAKGQSLAMADAMIAGIARSRGARIATRNVRDFSDTGVEVLDPWQTH